MKQPISSTIGLKGRVRCEVVDGHGNTVWKGKWQPNLLLDQGLNKLSTVLLADLFLYCAKGTGTTVVREYTGDLGPTHSAAGSTLTRDSGTRDFTVDDIGKLIKADTTGVESIITSITDTTHAELRGVGTNPVGEFTLSAITLFSVQQTGLTAEVGRTNNYSVVSGENGSTDDGSPPSTRTMKRTFVFDAEAVNAEDVAGSNTYSQAANTVTRTAGTRDFTAADVGKYLYFETSEAQVKITAFTSATQVDVDGDPATRAAQNITLYGYQDYNEIGFSDLAAAGNNLNIRVKLDSAARVYSANSVDPAQQLKVTYELAVTISPDTITAGTAPITDATNAMSGSKAGEYVIESFAMSRVDTDGSTLTSGAGLEPSVSGTLAISPVATALVALGQVNRSSGVSSTAMTADAYTNNSFTRTYRGSFGINTAINAAHRSLMLYSSPYGAFTFLFGSNQNKDGTHVLQVVFRKTWNRDL